jgi:hypothetical protein
VFGGIAVLAACAAPPKSTDLSLRPSPQQSATSQVVGESIVAALGGADVAVQWLPQAGVERFYTGRPGLSNPLPSEVWTEAPPTIFLLRIRNMLAEPVHFDPSTVLVSTGSGQRMHPVLYEEMYEQLVHLEDSAGRLQSLQATLLDRLLVVGPGGQREGIIVFRPFDPSAKQLALELGSLYLGGKATPVLFTFQVTRRQPQ